MRLSISLFEVYIALITLFKGFGASSDNKLYILAFAVGSAAVLLKMLKERFRIRELVPVMMIVGIGLLNFIFGNSSTILFTAITFCGLKNVNTTRILKLVFFIRVCTFALMILGYSFGITEEEILVFYRDGGFINRHSFGYGHPNIAHMSLAIIVLLALYLWDKRMSVIHYLIPLICNHWLYQYTCSRTGYCAIILSILLAIICRNTKINSFFMRLFKNIYIWLFILTLILGFGYGRIPVFTFINNLLTGRLHYLRRILSFVPPIFGTSAFNETINIDNGYIALLYEGGILAFLWLSYYTIRLTNYLYTKQRYRELFLVALFIIYNMTESFFPSISMNISLIFIGEVIYSKNARSQKWSSLRSSRRRTIARIN